MGGVQNESDEDKAMIRVKGDQKADGGGARGGCDDDWSMLRGKAEMPELASQRQDTVFVLPTVGCALSTGKWNLDSGRCTIW